MEIYRNNKKTKVKALDDIKEFLQVAHTESGNAKKIVLIVEYRNGGQVAILQAPTYYGTNKN